MSTYAVNLPSGETDEKGIFRLLGKLFYQQGVIESTALLVSAQATPDMTVKVSGSAASDNAIFITTNGDCYHGWNTASVNVTITANSSGITKTDAIVAYVDLTAGISTANNPGALKFADVRGSSGTPTTADITGSVVGSNPYIVLAYITVGNGVSSINSGNITDERIQAGIGQKLTDGLVDGPALATSAITLGYAQATSNQTGVTTVVDMTGLSVAVTVPDGGRKVRITGNTLVSSTVAGDVIRVSIKEGSTTLSIAQLPVAYTGTTYPAEPVAVLTPSAGSHTYKLTIERNAGTGSVTSTAASTWPAFILVEAI